MQATLDRILLAMSAAIVLLDATWLVAGHFRYDATNYALLFLMVLPLVAGAIFYRSVRQDEALSGVLACSGFLIVFPAAAALLSYLLVTIAGARIDDVLASADRAMGFDWPALMAFVAQYPKANALLGMAYLSVMPQTVLLIFALGFSRRTTELYGLSLALGLGAAMTLAIWTVAPSFGAFSVYTLPAPVAAKLGLALGFDYGHALVAMLRDGPGFISPQELRGIVGFPSYHTLQALVLMWYARNLAWLRWPVIALNLICLVAIPIQGGHHFVDMAGGTVVAVASIAMARRIVRFANKFEAVAGAAVVKPSFTAAS